MAFITMTKKCFRVGQVSTSGTKSRTWIHHLRIYSPLAVERLLFFESTSVEPTAILSPDPKDTINFKYPKIMPSIVAVDRAYSQDMRSHFLVFSLKATTLKWFC